MAAITIDPVEPIEDRRARDPPGLHHGEADERQRRVDGHQVKEQSRPHPVCGNA
jgi:hypothetical protein